METTETDKITFYSMLLPYDLNIPNLGNERNKNHLF